jgi:hypothetical protein
VFKVELNFDLFNETQLVFVNVLTFLGRKEKIK